MNLLNMVQLGLLAYNVYSALDNPEPQGVNDMTMTDLMTRSGVIGGVTVGGPGVPEPPQALVAKQWVIMLHSNTKGNFYMYFFKLIDGRVMSYHPYKGWKMWRPAKNVVLSRKNPSLRQAINTQTFLDKLWRRIAKNTKALKMATASSKRR